MLLRILLALATLCAAFAADSGALYRSFQNPPKSYSLMPYWYWNGKITPAETRRLLRQMVGQGVHRAVVFPWDGMDVRYLSEDYWRQVGAALDAARELGFTLNFADEYDWPSAHAWDNRADQPELSRVLQQHPEFRMTRLDYSEHSVDGPREWTLESPRDPVELVVAAREDAAGSLAPASFTVLETRAHALRWQAPAGRWVVTVYTRVPAVGAHNARVDLLNPAATKAYIEMVYGEYARRFPQHLGKTLKLTVADHEGAYGARIAFTPRLWEEFQTRKRYDLRRFLPLLVRHSSDGKFSRRVRADYLDVISDLYVDSFNKQVTRWCSEHRLQHATSLYEEQMSIQVELAGDMFRQWRAGTAVFIDALLERARMPIDFKEAVSVAHFDRKPLLVENQGLQGHGSYFSLEKARLGTNMCLLWGANALIPYFDYDPARIQWPPQWFTGQPVWRYFHHYADLVRRAQFMNSQGTHVAPVLLYYPRETAFAHADALLSNRRRSGTAWGNEMDHVQDFYSALQLELARAGWDYHILDSYYLERAEIRDAAIRLADETFRVLILPPMTEMEGAAMAQVRRFIDSGGVVLAVGQLPDGLDPADLRRFPARHHPLFMDRLDYLEYLRVPAGIREDLRPLLEALRAVEPPQALWLGEDTAGLYASHRRLPGADWYWVVNDTDRARHARLRVPGTGVFERWDAETGARENIGKSDLDLQFDPHDAFFLVRRDGQAPAPAPAPTPRQVLLELPATGWRLTLESPQVLVPYARVEGQSEPLWLAPERLSHRDWWLIGPFPYDDHQGFFRAYPPERDFQPGAAYAGAYGEVRWRWCASPTYTVTPRDLLQLPPDKTMGVYYAFAYVWSPQARPGQLLAAFADGLQVWWNGDRKLFEHRHPKWLLLRDCSAERRQIDIRQGWNRVLLKIEPSLMVPTAFLFRITDNAGATLRDLVYAREPLLPPPHPQRLRLTVAAPPGARDVILDVDAAQVPERPVAFPTRPVGFVLQSWTGTALEHYSGSALYDTNFTLPASARGKPLALDLGAVGVAAEVWVNGVKAGERAWRPFRFDITHLARPGVNALRVRVANSNAGWLAQGDPIYPRGSWGLKFRTERDRLPAIRPNGLEGPVRILGDYRP